MDPSRFQAEAPGRLVPTVDGVMAFAPDPLPRRLRLENSTAYLLERAGHGLGLLSGLTGQLKNPVLLGSPLLRREAIVSSRIEGTFTTAEELVLFEAGKPPEQAQRQSDTREVLNYVRAMRHGLKRLDDLPISLRLIRELHGVLLKGVRGDAEAPGDFRTAQNYIGDRARGIGAARFVPPPVPEMKSALHDLEKYIHIEDAASQRTGVETASEETPPLLVRLALVHYQFEAIHPFRDGNGRLGRLLIPLLLMSQRRLSAPLLYLSSYFERNRGAYCDHLLVISQTGVWTPWIDFFLQGIVESAEESVAQARNLLSMRDKWRSEFESARSSALLLKLIDRLFESPAIRIAEAARLLGVTTAAASHNIKKLVEAGILTERTGRVRNRLYLAEGIVRIIDDMREAGARR